MSIKLVIFDADDTLIDFQKCEKFGLQHVFSFLNLPLTDEAYMTFSEIDHTLWSKGIWKKIKVLRDDIPIRRFEILFKTLDIDYYDYERVNELFMRKFKDAIFPLEKSHKIIEQLYYNNIIVCVATNGLVKLQYPRILNTSFGRYVTQIVASEEVGEAKPNPKIFKKILNDNHMNSDEAIVIGDSLNNDILGSINASIKSVWFNPKNKDNHTSIKPDFIISDMEEIIEIINDINGKG